MSRASAVAGAVALGFLVRASFTFAAGFPIGDGGLFYQMVRDLQHAGYALPSTTTYNGDGIPYAYPPLMLYAAALVDRLTPLGLLDVLRILPLLGFNRPESTTPPPCSASSSPSTSVPAGRRSSV